MCLKPNLPIKQAAEQVMACHYSHCSCVCSCREEHKEDWQNQCSQDWASNFDWQSPKRRQPQLFHEAQARSFCYLMTAHPQCRWPGALHLDEQCRSALVLLLAACLAVHCLPVLLHTMQHVLLLLTQVTVTMIVTMTVILTTTMLTAQVSSSG